MLSLIREVVLPALGGITATYIYDGKKEKISLDGAYTDLQIVRELGHRLGLKWSDKDNIALYFDDAVQIIEEKWQAVEAFAKALVEQKRIVGNGVSRIINGNLNS